MTVNRGDWGLGASKWLDHISLSIGRGLCVHVYVHIYLYMCMYVYVYMLVYSTSQLQPFSAGGKEEDQAIGVVHCVCVCVTAQEWLCVLFLVCVLVEGICSSSLLAEAESMKIQWP